MFDFLKRRPKTTTSTHRGQGSFSGASFVVELSTHTDLAGEIEVAGTTTFARGAVEQLASRHTVGARDVLELDGFLQRDPDNPVDPQAVAVIVEGEKAGALPSYLAHTMDLPTGAAMPVRYQLHTLAQPGKKMKAKAFVWVGPGTPAWTYTQTHPAPLTLDERVQANHEHHQRAAANIDPKSVEGAAIRSGNMHGYTPGELIEPIKQLKRERRWDEALTLLYAAIEAEEHGYQATGRTPSPWFTEHAAIIHRRLNQTDHEIAVLQRYLQLLPEEHRTHNKIHDRLAGLQGNDD